MLRFVGRIDFVFGRLPKADVQLRDMKVSRLHTQLFIDSRGVAFVRDLGSSGGTVFNNQRMRKSVIAQLLDGTKLRIGDARITYYDAEPPVNALDPPCRSGPRGLIRTNHRERHFEADVTVLAVDKVSADTASGPAEPAPEINPNDFADEAAPAAPASSSTARKAPPSSTSKRRDTGIVEAPWDKQQAATPAANKRVTVPPPTRRGAQPPPQPMPAMETAEIDEEGNFHAPAAPAPAAPAPQRPVSPLPPRQPAPAAQRPVSPLPPRNVAQPSAPPPATEAFSKPVAFHGEMPVDEEEPRPRLGMPTVRLERPALQDRQQSREADESADESAEEAPKIPTARVDKSAPIADEPEPAPQIGVHPPNRPAEAEGADDEELTDEQIADYLGASVSGHFNEVDFGDGEGGQQEEENEEGEAVFGSARVSLEGSDDIDIETGAIHPPAEDAAESAPETDEFVPDNSEVTGQEAPVDLAVGAAAVDSPAEEPAEESAEVPEDMHVEPTTSMLGTTTAIREEFVADEPIADVTPSGAPTPDHVTPPPIVREGASSSREFKPRKTRKLMKRRTETLDKKTDKTLEEDRAETAKTEFISQAGDLPVAPGAKTMFVPKPDNTKLSRGAPEIVDEEETGVPKRLAENIEKKSLQDLGEGPGGDTVALPGGMANQLRAEMARLEKEQKDKKKNELTTIGDNPTVKTTSDDDEEEFILDDNYAFFTPPPPTRKGAKRPVESDVINANDFHSETDNLPPEKRAKAKGDPDTLAE
ncbi:MAG: FHA domain-containing protein [Planctomycetes bacterium]|nr:FHA domain-containing protein [Planctomycetota bacterium]MCW8134377.1 FHA domain-containing protein [Planctomycetota bacterium]